MGVCNPKTPLWPWVTISVIVFHMLKNQQRYRDLGADYFDRGNAEQLKGLWFTDWSASVFRCR